MKLINWCVTVLMLTVAQTQCGGTDADSDGYTPAEGDCNDSDWNVKPGVYEICDEIDNNCDGYVDDGITPPWYPDTDGDGYGVASMGVIFQCNQPAGYTSVPGDCDDANAAVSPATIEICNGIDDDCTGIIDDVPANWYRDVDADGYGDDTIEPIRYCQSNVPIGYVTNHTDCDDVDSSVYPGAQDVDGDGIDQDCGNRDGQQSSVGLPTSTPGNTIPYAIAQAQSGDVIWIGPGHYTVTELYFYSKTLTLASVFGPEETILDGEQQGRVIDLVGPGNDGTIQGFTVTGGITPNDAGGLSASNVSLQLTDMIFHDNIAGNRGGATFFLWSHVVIKNCQFYDNSGFYGGAVAMYDTTFLADHVTINRNAAEIGGGGIDIGSSDVTLTNSQLTHNYSSYDGGGIYSQDSILAVSNSMLTGNTVHAQYQGGGGALYSEYDVNIDLENVQITDNIVSGDAGGSGGGLSFGGTEFYTLTNCAISNNWSFGSDAAGTAGITSYYAHFAIIQSVVTGNTAVDQGDYEYINGGMFIGGLSGGTIIGSVFAYNWPLNLMVEYTEAEEYFETELPLDVAYSDLYNPIGYATDSIRTEDVAVTTLVVEPKFLVYDSAGIPADWHLAVDSSLINASDPSVLDLDGSRSDIGIYGGSVGDGWELDGDGYPSYFWSGIISNVPTGFNPALFDSNDHTVAVH